MAALVHRANANDATDAPEPARAWLSANGDRARPGLLNEPSDRMRAEMDARIASRRLCCADWADGFISEAMRELVACRVEVPLATWQRRPRHVLMWLQRSPGRSYPLEPDSRDASMSCRPGPRIRPIRRGILLRDTCWRDVASFEEYIDAMSPGHRTAPRTAALANVRRRVLGADELRRGRQLLATRMS